MNEITKQQYIARATVIATQMSKRMIDAYTASVQRYVHHYTEPPNEDDFFAWLEGYEWTDPQQSEK